MAYLEVEEMTTHIYEEDMDTISHGDDVGHRRHHRGGTGISYQVRYRKDIRRQGKGTQSHIAALCKGHSRLALL